MVASLNLASVLIRPKIHDFVSEEWKKDILQQLLLNLVELVILAD